MHGYRLHFMKSWRPRIGLRALFVVVAVCALLFAINRPQREQTVEGRWVVERMYCDGEQRVPPNWKELSITEATITIFYDNDTELGLYYLPRTSDGRTCFEVFPSLEQAKPGTGLRWSYYLDGDRLVIAYRLGERFDGPKSLAPSWPSPGALNPELGRRAVFLRRQPRAREPSR